MTIDLWKLEGLASSYNPLPTGFLVTNKINALPIGEYVVSFYAYSPTNRSIRIKLDTITNANVYTQVLTPTRTLYTATFKNPYIQTCYILGVTSLDNDIVIDSIKFTRKPLGNLTLNMIDGFLSGKWSSSSKYTDVDDANTILNAITTNDNRYLLINVLPNTNYTVSVDKTKTTGLTGIFNSDASVSLTSGYTSSQVYTFNSGNNTLIRFYISNYGMAAGQYTFGNIVMSLGALSSPVPYSKKTGDRGAIPRPQKNLCDNDLLTGYQGITLNYIDTTSDGYKRYGISGTWNAGTYPYSMCLNSYHPGYRAKVSYSASMNIYTNVPNKFTSSFGNLIVVNDGGMTGGQVVYRNGTFSAFQDYIHSTNGYQSNQVFVQSCPIANGTVFDPTTDFVYVKNVLIEKSKTFTSYEPYVLKANMYPKRPIPKKNLYRYGDVTVTAGVSNNPGATSAAAFADVTEGIVSGGTYTFSSLYTIFADDTSTSWRASMVFKYADGTADTYNNGVGIIPKDGIERPVYVTATANPSKTLSKITLIICDYSTANNIHRTVRNIQVEQGLQTAYEAYSHVLQRSAKKGLVLNGLTQNVTVSTPMPNSAFSYEIMFRANGPQNYTYGYASIVGWRYSTEACRSLQLGSADNLYIHDYNGTDLAPATQYNIKQGVDYKAKVVYDGVKLYLYVNDVLIASQTQTLSNGNQTELGIGGIILASSNTVNRSFNGTIYYYKQWDANGNLVINHDYTNPNSIPGYTIINGQQNLVPDFESGRWHFAAGAKILGKEVVHFDSLPKQNISYVSIPVIPGSTYLAHMPLPLGTILKLQTVDTNGVVASFKDDAVTSLKFTVASNITNIYYTFYTYPNTEGVDFVKPQLYLLDGTEGTVNGFVSGSIPKLALKRPKRVLYNKR